MMISGRKSDKYECGKKSKSIAMVSSGGKMDKS
jgi:hypothetical protein